MERVGVRELRRDASGILRRVAGGETIEVTDRGRPVAILVKSSVSGVARLEREGVLRRGAGRLLDVRPIRLRPGVIPPSAVVAEGRVE